MYRFAALIAVLAGCGDPPLECAVVDLACAPQYEPTFENVFENTLVPDCSSGACHDAVAPRGGLDLSEIETAYEGLQSRLDVDDVACSELVARLYTDEPAWHMPRGETLAESETCAVMLWVAAGAPREATISRP